MILKSEIRNPKSEKSFKYFNSRNFKFVSNFVLLASCLLVLAAPLTIFAQGFTALAPIPGLTDTDALSVAKSTNLASFFNNLYKYLIGLAAVLAVIMIIWGGLEISTQDSVSKNKDGKEKIYNAIFGLVLVLSPVLVFSIINPSILNLSINLPKLDTKSGAPVQTGINPEVPSPGPNGTIIFREGWRAVAVPGTYCFTTPPSAEGNYYCASDTNKCRIAYNSMCSPAGTACSAVTSPCTPY